MDEQFDDRVEALRAVLEKAELPADNASLEHLWFGNQPLDKTRTAAGDLH